MFTGMLIVDGQEYRKITLLEDLISTAKDYKLTSTACSMTYKSATMVNYSRMNACIILSSNAEDDSPEAFKVLCQFGTSITEIVRQG